MRIAFVTQWFDPEPAAIRGLPLATWLVERGHQVRVVTGYPNYPQGRLYPGYSMGRVVTRETTNGVDVVRVPLYPSHDSSGLRRAANYLSFAASASTLGTLLVGDADVIYAYHPPPTVGAPALLWGRLRRAPVVYHIADMWPDSVTGSGMLPPGVGRAVERALRWWCNRVYRASAAITVLSPGFKRLLVERGVPAEKVSVILNWADEAIFYPRPPDEELARKLGIDGRFNIVYAGNLGPYQNLHRAIEAMQELAHLPDVQLVLVGTGLAEGDLRAMVDRRGMKNVRFLDRRPYSEMGAVSALADVQLVSLAANDFFETTIPSKTQVALAMGRPVLMVARGDAADLVLKAGAGKVVAPDDVEGMAAAIESLYRLGPAALAEMGAQGRDFYLRESSLHVGGERMEELLRQVVAEAVASRGR